MPADIGPQSHLSTVLNDVFGSPSSSDSEGSSLHESSRFVKHSRTMFHALSGFPDSLPANSPEVFTK